MYHDAISYKEVYQGGKLNTLSPHEYIDETLLSREMEGNPASQHVPLGFMESLFTHYFMAKMVNQARFVEELDDVNAFTEKLIDQSQDLYEDLRLYTRAYKNPGPFKLQAFIHNLNFYNENDELLQFVRHVQEHGKPHPAINLQEALEKAKGQSQYARALKRSYDFTRAASDFFNAKISKDEVYDAVEIFHEPHRV
jgi:hypothetical protein